MHPDGCDCAAHDTPRDSGSWLTAALPALACAVCPACLSLYAKLASITGVSWGLSEATHERLLFMAVGVSLVVSAWRTWRRRRAWPLGVATIGAAGVLAGHALGHGVGAGLEWCGVLIMLVGGLAEHFSRARTKVRVVGVAKASARLAAPRAVVVRGRALQVLPRNTPASASVSSVNGAPAVSRGQEADVCTP